MSPLSLVICISAPLGVVTATVAATVLSGAVPAYPQPAVPVVAATMLPSPSSLPPTPTATEIPFRQTPRPSATAKAPPTARPQRSRISGGGVNTGVGVYSDCTGRSPVPRWEAEIDTCVVNRPFFIGHNPGVFAPFMGDGIGTAVDWWDAGGVEHQFRVLAERDWLRSAGVPPPLPGETATVQTCVTQDGSVDRILSLG